MAKKINVKKAILWGIVAWILQIIIGNLLWMNPLSIEINEKFSGHPTIKSFDFLGGMTNWILLTFAFGAFLALVWIVFYLILYETIPGNGWVKGLCFGFGIAVVKVIPEAFNQWMLFVYPESLILLQLVNSLLGTTIFGVVLGFFYSKFRVVTSIPVL